MAVAILGNTEDAEEAMQDTFLKALRHLGQFRRDASLPGSPASLDAGRHARGASDLAQESPRIRPRRYDIDRPYRAASPQASGPGLPGPHLSWNQDLALRTRPKRARPRPPRNSRGAR
ncbi:MAG: hypothetical protein HRJ53_23645 [Acidobacteria bacterium Pan2503]|uniref:RNA polymerase sigma-70 region 2 domain-containing protein n=1 Tax=Candidatus Acidiferrum panamense TaxID=2741543 RepID=A0A7V8SZH0_9BACT|nr:hypothetical protein [Candidatus Acidoferrum panamensis]